MPNLSGITIALQAVLAQSQAMQIIEHNIANANTPGYRRQSAILTATVPAPVNGSDYVKGGPGQVGTGVTIDRIQRFSLQLFDGRYRSVGAESKNWEAQSNVLGQFEAIMTETSDDGMLAKFDQFWSGWRALSNDPTNASLRTILLDDANSLANGFKRRYEQINQLRIDQNLMVSDQVDQVNALAGDVASLNAEISRVLSVGDQPNDLLDKRDLALDKLAQLTGSVSYEQKNGEVSVSIGGHVLVVGHDAFKLRTVQNTSGDPTVADVFWEDNQKVILPSGELKGILDVRDIFLKNQQTELNTVASKFISEVNAIHITGYGPSTVTPENFFVAGGDASNIAVQIQDPGKVATSSAPFVAGKNDIALAISKLKDATLMTRGTVNVTMNNYYNGLVTDRALAARRADENSTQQSAVLKSLDLQRESASGVSLDEEAANMARTQKAYQAAARVLTAYDEMLDTVINRMGMVGR
jgi:flagellar hook-associated protein 1 FlgK